MAKTIVIKGADYSANAFDVVKFGNTPCESISISQDSVRIDGISSTVNITAEVTPVDTTDVVVWETSNDNVATVVNGVITSCGIGSATITARCGAHSATCAVEVKSMMDGARVLGVYISGDGAATGGNGLPTLATNAIRAGLLADSGTLRFYSQFGGAYYYPYVMPAGTKKLRVNTHSDVIKPDTIEWFNSATAAQSSAVTCRLIAKQNLSAYTDLSGNIYEINVGTYDGYVIDACAVGFKCFRSGDDTFLQTDLDAITVEFLAD